MRLPTLYKKTNTGAIQEWTIEVRDLGDRGQIITTYGHVNGAKQTTHDDVFEGKNIGKKNETTAVEQAKAEAQSKWEKQKKKGYVEAVADAQAGEVDAIIEGGVAPMLAQSYSKHAEKIVFPCFAQPKLDGIRCIAVLHNGKATLWTRTRKAITSVPHIVAAIEAQFAGQNIVLDGELYNHALKADFEKIVSLVRKDGPSPGHEKVQYHIYDIVETGKSFMHRYVEWTGNAVEPLVRVQTLTIVKEDEIMEAFDIFTNKGYEGAIVRNAATKYEVGKRSYGLQKVKEFVDDEFDIVGVEEGRGNMAGRAVFVCKTAEGKTFNAKMEGPLDGLRKYLTNHSLWQGKKLTVKYQNLTKDGIPRFPVGKAVRDYE